MHAATLRLSLVVIAMTALLVPGLASAHVPAGRYAGETMNILFGPARVHFEVVLNDRNRVEVKDFWCGCAAGSVWKAETSANNLDARAHNANQLTAMMDGNWFGIEPGFEGIGALFVSGGNVQRFKWSAALVPDLAAASQTVHDLQVALKAERRLVSDVAQLGRTATTAVQTVELQQATTERLLAAASDREARIARDERRTVPAVYGLRPGSV